jgi:hypothetical protein
MKAPSTTREALLAEALGEMATLMRQVETLVPALDASCQALTQAQRGLADQLASFDIEVTELTERAKARAVNHIVARTNEVTQYAIKLQGQAMAEAARQALSTEMGATLQQLRWAVHSLMQPEPWRWEPWLTHAAAATTAAAATWMLAVVWWGR